MSWATEEMKSWLPTLLSELHRESLKPQGYRKERRTFVRDCGAYKERYNFQGSSWNGTGVKWRFYLNVGLEFTDLEPRQIWSYFANTHWATRIPSVVPEAPHWWDYSEQTDRAEIKKELAQLICRASEGLKVEASNIRNRYLAKQRP